MKKTKESLHGILDSSKRTNIRIIKNPKKRGRREQKTYLKSNSQELPKPGERTGHPNT